MERVQPDSYFCMLSASIVLLCVCTLQSYNANLPAQTYLAILRRNLTAFRRGRSLFEAIHPEIVHAADCDPQSKVIELLATEQRAGVTGTDAEFFFDSQELIVLGHAVRSARRTSFDLTGRQSHRQVGDG